MLQNMGIDEVVDEDTDGRETRRERCRTGPEGRLEIDELVVMTCVQLIEHHALVVLRAEDCNPHFIPP